MHELAQESLDLGQPHLELVQEKAADQVIVVRCPSCKGLRSVAARHVTRNGKICRDCTRGHVIPRTQFHNYWTARFSMEEIRDMGRAIWG